MAALMALAVIGLLFIAAICGLLGVVSVAIRREERNLTLTNEATSTVIRVARSLNGVYVRVPRHAEVWRITEPQTRLPWPGWRARPHAAVRLARDIPPSDVS